MVAGGIGFHTPYGSSIQWPTTSPSANVVTEQSLRTYFLSAAIGFDLNEDRARG